MRRAFSAAGYILAHVLFYTALFLPPLFIPNHSMKGGGEYSLWLMITLWPVSSLIAGMVCSLIPGVSGKVRVFSVAAGLLIGFVCLCLERSEAPELVLIYGVIYAVGFFFTAGLVRLIRSFYCGYRAFREKGERK